MKSTDNYNNKNVFEISKNGTMCLLHNVHFLDNKDYRNGWKNSILTRDELSASLQTYFLGEYYLNRMKYPVDLHNASNLHVYINFLISSTHQSFQRIYLYLLGYNSFIEISVVS